MSLIDNLTFKCSDSNRGDVSFTFNKDTNFHKDYYLPVTDFQLLMIVQGVLVNDLWNRAMITDHHCMIEKIKLLKATSSNHNNNQYYNNNWYIYCESHLGLSVCYEC